MPPLTEEVLTDSGARVTAVYLPQDVMVRQDSIKYGVSRICNRIPLTENNMPKSWFRVWAEGTLHSKNGKGSLVLQMVAEGFVVYTVTVQMPSFRKAEQYHKLILRSFSGWYDPSEHEDR